jgi:hypothetical protein
MKCMEPLTAIASNNAYSVVHCGAATSYARVAVWTWQRAGQGAVGSRVACVFDTLAKRRRVDSVAHGSVADESAIVHTHLQTCHVGHDDHVTIVAG